MATLAEAKRIVVKIGSALLVERSSGALRQNWAGFFGRRYCRFSRKGRGCCDRVLRIYCSGPVGPRSWHRGIDLRAKPGSGRRGANSNWPGPMSSIWPLMG